MHIKIRRNKLYSYNILYVFVSSFVASFIITGLYLFFDFKKEDPEIWGQISYFQKEALMFSVLSQTESKPLRLFETLKNNISKFQPQIAIDDLPNILDVMGGDPVKSNQQVETNFLHQVLNTKQTELLLSINGKNHYIYNIYQNEKIRFILVFPLKKNNLKFAEITTKSLDIKDRYRVLPTYAYFLNYWGPLFSSFLIACICQIIFIILILKRFKASIVHEYKKRRALIRATNVLKIQLKSERYKAYSQNELSKEYKEKLLSFVVAHLKDFEHSLPTLKNIDPIDSDKKEESFISKAEIILFNPYKGKATPLSRLMSELERFFRNEIWLKGLSLKIVIDQSKVVVKIDDTYFYCLAFLIIKSLIDMAQPGSSFSIKMRTRGKFLIFKISRAVSSITLENKIIESIANIGGIIKNDKEYIEIKLPLDIFRGTSKSLKVKDNANVVQFVKKDS